MHVCRYQEYAIWNDLQIAISPSSLQNTAKETPETSPLKNQKPSSTPAGPCSFQNTRLWIEPASGT